MTNKRNDAMYRAKQAYMDILRYGRVLTHGGAMLHHNTGQRQWKDDNGYLVTINDGKIVEAKR